MRRIALLTAGLLLPLGPVFAGGWLVGGNLGSVQGDTTAGELNNQLADQGLNATASSNDDNRSAWQLYLGYQYTPEWGVEIGYIDLGEVNTTIDGTTADITAFLTSASDIHPQTAHGWQMSGVYRRPIAEKSWAVLRAGVLGWESDYRLSAAGVTRNVGGRGMSGTFGIGIEVDGGKNTRVGIGYQRYNIDDEPISMLSVGVSYSL